MKTKAKGADAPSVEKIAISTRVLFIAADAGDRDDLERVILAQTGDFTPTATSYAAADRVVWLGDRLAAVIRRGPDGRAEVTKFRLD